MTAGVPQHWRWFTQCRFGLFIHWGPYAQYGRGEQVLFREHLDQRDYERRARAWNPTAFDPHEWARIAVQAGMKYAVLTTRHHDGYCLWDSARTDYTSLRQAPKRDFVREYVEAFRAAGLRIGLYYSLADWRIPAYWEGPQHDPEGWTAFRDDVHAQVRELLTHYGQIDLFWFDGAWPHTATEWKSRQLVEMMRSIQPHILINKRLSTYHRPDEDAKDLGDFGTPEHQITPEPGRLWESCQVSTWRLWGYAKGERWRPADVLLDMLVECAAQGGNLLLNVGPDADGRIPQPFIDRANDIGQWLKIHGQGIYDTEPGEVCEFVSYGWQTRKGNNLYLIIRFWTGEPTLTLAGLETKVKRATLLTSGAQLAVRQEENYLHLDGLPAASPTPLFPVIHLECESPPTARPWAVDRLWMGDPRRMTPWARSRVSETRS